MAGACGSTANSWATASVDDVLHEMKTKDIARQRAKIGMVFQRFNLFPHRTALENVMEGPVHVKQCLV